MPAIPVPIFYSKNNFFISNKIKLIQFHLFINKITCIKELN